MFSCFVLVDEFLLPEAVGLLFFVACSKVMVRFVTVQTGQPLRRRKVLQVRVDNRGYPPSQCLFGCIVRFFFFFLFLRGFVLCIAGCDPEEGVEFDVTLVVYDSVLDCDFWMSC